MRLMYFEDGRYRLTEYFHNYIPPYAILSHRWGTTNDEVSFQDIAGAQDGKTGWAKLKFCREQAQKDNLKYFWIDTCCIDKSDAKELSRAIVSMFKWYANAQHCYVYLGDVTAWPLISEGEKESRHPWKRAFARSQWFTRGWTLQELLAPPKLSFYSVEGVFLGTRTALSEWIRYITGIDKGALNGRELSEYSEAVRFQWAVNRRTTEPEDQAYCLLGIFGVSMPPHYGEGQDEAYDRLKEAISRKRHNELMKLNPRQGQQPMRRQSMISLASSQAPSVELRGAQSVSEIRARKNGMIGDLHPTAQASHAGTGIHERERRPYSRTSELSMDHCEVSRQNDAQTSSEVEDAKAPPATHTDVKPNAMCDSSRVEETIHYNEDVRWTFYGGSRPRGFDDLNELSELDKERLARLDRERLHKERLAQLDKELDKERLDKERLDKERLDKERLAQPSKERQPTDPFRMSHLRSRSRSMSARVGSERDDESDLPSSSLSSDDHVPTRHNNPRDRRASANGDLLQKVEEKIKAFLKPAITAIRDI